MARNVIYYNDNSNPISLAGIANLPYTDVILCFLSPASGLSPEGDLGVYGNGGALDANLQSNIQALQNAGKKVLVSFGGSSNVISSSDWKRCTENVLAFDPDGQSALTNNIITFLATHGFDGIDIDYEDDSGFDGTGGYDGVQFPIALTLQISRFLPNYRNIITHAPQPPYWDPNYYLWASQGTAPYTQIWQQVGDLITWINCQFYDQGYPYDDDDADRVQ